MSNFPKLRFPEFEGEWEGNELGKYLVEFDKKVTRKNGYSILTSSRAGLFLQNAYFKQEVISKANALYRVLPKGYFTYRYMSDDSFFRININELGFDGLVSQEYPVFTTNEELNKVFLKEHLYGSKAFYAFCAIQKRGGTRTRLYLDTLKKYRIIMPTLPEQTKIADFFTLIDNKITKQDEKVAALEQYKKGLMQKIFAREIRFKDDNGKDYPEWLWEQLLKVGEKIRDKNDDFRITNVISNSAIKGLIKQRDYFEKDIANIQNINNYYIIKHGDFVYNPRKSNEAPYGPIKIYKSYELGIVSPLYLCFRLKKEIGINEVFISYFFDSKKWHKYICHYADRGARYDRVSMQDTRFFEMKIPLPSNEEQIKIANFLSLYDRKIEKEKAKLEALREQKKGLLQQMFV